MSGGAGINGSINCGGDISANTITASTQITGVYKSIAANSSFTATSNFTLPSTFKELVINIRDLSTTTGGQVRLALRSSTTALTHLGCFSGLIPAGTVTTGFSGYLILSTAVAAEFQHLQITITKLDGTNFYMVKGSGYNSYPYTIDMFASVTGSNPIDNMQFSVSAGALDLTPRLWIDAIF